MKRQPKKEAPASPCTLINVATDAILESISDGVFTVDQDWRVLSFNRAAEIITGIPREEAIGRRCSDVFRATHCEGDCALRQTMESGAPTVNKATFIVHSSGTRIPISVSTAILRNENGTVVGGAETFRDLTVLEELRTQVRSRFQVGDIISRSVSMRRLLDVLLTLRIFVRREDFRGQSGSFRPNCRLSTVDC
jgi:PAS domain S-box-containing protein